MLCKGVFVPDWPDLPAQFGALSTVRQGGVSLAPYDDGKGGGGLNLGDHVGDNPAHVQKNRQLLAHVLPVEPSWLTQVHGIKVIDLATLPRGVVKTELNQEHFIADAAITRNANQVCSILTADCLPVLLCDPVNNSVAAAHAGWRGLADGVLESTVTAMCQTGADPESILVWLGPAIGPTKFEVGAEVRERFTSMDANTETAFKPTSQQRNTYFADIYQLARIRFNRLGISRIAGGNYCTVSQSERFFSYRRDGVTGRMASMIWIK